MIDRPQLSVADLRRRGWSDTLIRRFLGEAHDWEPVDHWANYTGKRMYFLDIVEEIEKSSDFQQALALSVRRRKVTDEGFTRFREAQAETAGLVEHWKSQLTPEALERELRVATAADMFKEARRRGYRTPHKC